MKSKLMISYPENNYLFTEGCIRKYVDRLKKDISEIPVYFFFLGVLSMLFLISGIKAFGFHPLWSMGIILASWIGLLLLSDTYVSGLKEDLQEALEYAGALLTTKNYDTSVGIDLQGVKRCSIRTNPGWNYHGWILRMSFVYKDVCYVTERHPSHIGHLGWKIFIEGVNSSKELDPWKHENIPILAEKILEHVRLKHNQYHPR
jgi:hypothetical protein